MEKLSGLRPILIGLIVIHGLWLMMGAFDIFSDLVYTIIPPAIRSLLSAVGNGLQVAFYVILLTALPAQPKARD